MPKLHWHMKIFLFQLAKTIHTIEINESLYKQSKRLLNALGYKNVHVHLGDGSVGLQEYSPYDTIMVTAVSPYVPQELTDQLKDGGRIIIPASSSRKYQMLIIGKEGW